MWPTHCVQGTHGAEFHQEIEYIKEKDRVVSKGMVERVDSYSGFGSHPEKTELEEILREEKIGAVYCVGLAFDYCVGSTAHDA
jgi:nicotinamidase-related amidase